MFPLAHIYVSTEVTGKKSDLLVFGSILPDISVTSKNELGKDEIHYSPVRFLNFIELEYRDLYDLAVGVKLHSNINKGADFYSDDNSFGYAKTKGRQIKGEVVRFLGVSGEKKSLILAHSFIEATVDLNLKDSHPHLISIYEHSITNCNLQRITTCLSEYLNKDRKLIYAELRNLVKTLNPQHFSSSKTLVERLVIPLIELRFGKKATPKKAYDIINKAKSLTRRTYLDFLENTVKKMRISFPELISRPCGT